MLLAKRYIFEKYIEPVIITVPGPCKPVGSCSRIGYGFIFHRTCLIILDTLNVFIREWPCNASIICRFIIQISKIERVQHMWQVYRLSESKVIIVCDSSFRTSFPFFRIDNNYPVRSTRTIDSCRSSIFQHFPHPPY